MTTKQFAHMQMFPTDSQDYYASNVPWILEQKGFIGLGEWEGGEKQINDFKKLKYGDIVLIHTGAMAIALVQIIGGHYFVSQDEDPDERTEWINNRMPIRVLDWNIGNLRAEVPKVRGTIEINSPSAQTYQYIQEWFTQIKENYQSRGLEIV
ncbi:hypothetical protein [Suttonella ornithocola]|uniref:EVE domain-containing protein n=1 Tax=Suttonella ornithocola TaxID=279832 RepID=A0A380MSR9_9GAMM|nr:hypothetical protein [Suttonella ornithocola]SUO95669.1 Uncharacterised protein [Suttonella ornithocola]